jgi:hypothetical protein
MNITTVPASLASRVSALAAESQRARTVHARHADVTPAAMLAFLKLAEPAIASLGEGTWVDLMPPEADLFCQWLRPKSGGRLRVRVATPGDPGTELEGEAAEAAVLTMLDGADFFVWAEEVLARVEARIAEMEVGPLGAEVEAMQALVELANTGRR